MKNLRTKLSYTIYILLVAFLFCGCETTVDKKSTGLEFYGKEIEVITIDNCEYIYVPNGNASWGAHKGNCKFCAERSKKQVSNSRKIKSKREKN